MLWFQTDVGDAGLQNQPQEHLTSAASFSICSALILEEGKTNMGKKNTDHILKLSDSHLISVEN